MSQKKWTPEITKTLVELYGLHPVLYKVDVPNYHNKVLRSNALQAIKVELETQYKICFSESDVLKKINNLRSQFLECLRLKKKTAASGSGTEIKSVWWLFEHMQFLLPYCNKDKGKSNISISSCTQAEDVLETIQNSEELVVSERSDTLIGEIEEYILTPALDEMLGSPTPSVDNIRLSTDVGTVENTPSNKKKRQKLSSTTELDEYMKNAIDEITGKGSVKETFAIKPEVQTLCKFIETELNSFESKRIFNNVKWEILGIIKKYQDDE